jgi:hypothetical protein
MKEKMKFFVALTVLTILWVLPAGAQWSHDPFENNPVCTATEDQERIRSVSDGAGGTIIVWEDSRSGNVDIYAQLVDASGNTLWTTAGEPVCTATGIQDQPQLVSDGAGGAIISWDDYRSGGTSDLYAQRVDASGSMLWTADGEAVCTLTGDQFYSQLTSDGAGGAIITWLENRNFIMYANYEPRVVNHGTQRII